MTEMSDKSLKPAASRRDARQEGRRLVGNRQGHRRGAAHRARGANPAFPAVQHSVGLARADLARRRLSVRLQIRLRLFAFLAAELPRLLPAGVPGRVFASEPKRGDIIVFKLPSDGQTDYIKRLIGLPGDKIQVQHGRLFINGEEVPREQIAPYPTVNHFGKPEEAPRYLETLPGGVKHEIIQIDGDEGTFDNTKVYEVPPGHYFFMGDNRDNSSNSRLAADQGGVGYVPFENLIGRGEVIFFSIGDDTPALADLEVAVGRPLGPDLPARPLTALSPRLAGER